MDTSTPPPPPPAANPGSSTPPAIATGEDKTVAIVSYLTLIGFIAAVIIHSNKKTQLGAFHLRQMLGILLTSLLCIIPFLNILILIFLFVIWIMGLISAIKGEIKPVPLVGALYQKWFGNAFS